MLSFPKQLVDKPKLLRLNILDILPTQERGGFLCQEVVVKDVDVNDRIRFPRMRIGSVVRIGSGIKENVFEYYTTVGVTQEQKNASATGNDKVNHVRSNEVNNIGDKNQVDDVIEPAKNNGPNNNLNNEQNNLLQNNILSVATQPMKGGLDLCRDPESGDAELAEKEEEVSIQAKGEANAGHFAAGKNESPIIKSVDSTNFPKLVCSTVTPPSKTFNKDVPPSPSSPSTTSSPLNYNFTSSSFTNSQFSPRKCSSASEGTNFDETFDETAKEYIPATFDLTKPLRRFSIQFTQQDLELLQEYTNNNCIYQKDMVPTSTTETVSVSSSSSSSSTIKPPLSQVYQCKKPLGTPAVLRPIKSTNNLPQSQPLQLSQFNYGQLSTIPLQFNLPTHQHWKPNDFTNHCMRCTIQFTSSLINFLNNNIISKHHCRFCGGIYCQSCLRDSNAVLLDDSGRFIFNLSQDVEVSKSTKVCLKCAYVYNFLQQELLKILKLGWFFVDNPHINPKFSFTPLKIVEEEKRKSLGDMPSDWTWSSF